MGACDKVDLNLAEFMGGPDDSDRFLERLAKHALSGGIIFQQGGRDNIWRCICRAALRRTASALSFRVVKAGTNDGRTRPGRNNPRPAHHGLAVCGLYWRVATS